MDATQRPPASIDAMRHQVARVLDHHSFARSRGPARLLKHLADRLAANGGLPVTQAELAKVLGLPKDFDPSRNPLVRMHMSKLRRMMTRYATGDGRHDPVVLELPCNSYQLRAYASPTHAAAGGGGAVNGSAAAYATHASELPSTRGENIATAPSLRHLVLVSEFECPTDYAGGAALTRLVASCLVAELFDNPQFAAIGPVHRSRIMSEGISVAEVARRCRVRFYIEGEMSLGRRGLQLSLRLAYAENGATFWTDWLDDPIDLATDGIEQSAQLFATRIADRLRRCPTIDPVPAGIVAGMSA